MTGGHWIVRVNLSGRGSRRLWSKEVMFAFSEQSPGGRGPHSTQPKASFSSKPTLDSVNHVPSFSSPFPGGNRA